MTASTSQTSKLLVFAHVPPPHHGQSYMVRLMLQGFGGDCRKSEVGGEAARLRYGIHCYHVNARFSKALENIGDFQFRKVLLVFWYCLQAIWCRVRHGVKTLYYIPAPGKRSALYRDWLILFLCRPFFPRLVLHWQAAGLDRWLELESTMYARALTFRALGRADASVALSSSNCQGISKFFPRKACVVYNAIPDPCPQFETAILPRRLARLEARKILMNHQPLSPAQRDAAGGDPEICRVLFLALCTREKGIFDAIDAVRRAQQELKGAGSPIRFHLSIAGGFTNPEEIAEFEQRLALPGLGATIEHVGFIEGERKAAMLRDSDVLCFPTYYLGENHPVSTVEALAYGLPVITTRWRSLPEFFPADYRGIVDPKDVAALSVALVEFLSRNDFVELRNLFCERYTAERHLSSLAAAIRFASEHKTTVAE